MIYAVVYVVVWLAAAVYLARRTDVHKDADSNFSVGYTSLVAAAFWPLALVLRGATLFGKLTRRPQADAPPDPLLAALDELASEWESPLIPGERTPEVHRWYAARLRQAIADNT